MSIELRLKKIEDKIDEIINHLDREHNANYFESDFEIEPLQSFEQSITTIKCPLWNEKGWPRCLHLDNKIGVCHDPEGICEAASRKTAKGE